MARFTPIWANAALAALKSVAVAQLTTCRIHQDTNALRTKSIPSAARSDLQCLSVSTNEEDNECTVHPLSTIRRTASAALG